MPIFQKTSIFKTLTSQMLLKKVKKSTKTIFLTAEHISLIKKAKFETNHDHLYKLCLLKWAIFLKKTTFLNL